MKRLILACLCALAATVDAAEIQIGKTSELRLGFGVDVDLEKVFGACMDFDPTAVRPEEAQIWDAKSPSGSHYLSVSTEFITSSRQLDEFSRSGVAAGIQYLALGASVSSDSSSMNSLSSDQIAIGIRAVADYGRWYLNHDRLRPEMNRLADINLEEFHHKCGHEYVSGYRLGQGLTVVIKTMKELSVQADRWNFSTDVGFSFGPFSAGAAAAFASAAGQLLKYGSLEVELTEFGGGPLSSVATIITSKKDIDQFASRIESFVSNLSPSYATKTTYVTSEYPVGQPNYSPIIADEKRNALWNLFSDYRKIRNDLNRLKELVRSDFAGQYGELCQASGPMSCNEYMSYIKKLVNESETAIDTINKAAVRCAENTDVRDCEAPAIWTVNPELSVNILWPQQFRRLLYEAKLKQISRRQLP